ncbi:hypothetical protein CAEBREN_12362 [Caenorhabditis brenneri]|uniref:Uncharacterized protein n=1 Tax=Caenorhabditis brenneri TaxID=135651 RepID=G0NI31_CAEBE|nr:hypothetical protein CAEBREN_12362 [Caenorhabditis brenneri]
MRHELIVIQESTSWIAKADQISPHSPAIPPFNRSYKSVVDNNSGEFIGKQTKQNKEVQPVLNCSENKGDGRFDKNRARFGNNDEEKECHHQLPTVNSFKSWLLSQRLSPYSSACLEDKLDDDKGISSQNLKLPILWFRVNTDQRFANFEEDISRVWRKVANSQDSPYIQLQIEVYFAVSSGRIFRYSLPYFFSFRSANDDQMEDVQQVARRMKSANKKRKYDSSDSSEEDENEPLPARRGVKKNVAKKPEPKKKLNHVEAMEAAVNALLTKMGKPKIPKNGEFKLDLVSLFWQQQESFAEDWKKISILC